MLCQNDMVMTWTSAHCEFGVETLFFNIGEFLIATQRAFCAHFMLHWNDIVTAWTGAHCVFAVEMFF